MEKLGATEDWGGPSLGSCMICHYIFVVSFVDQIDDWINKNVTVFGICNELYIIFFGTGINCSTVEMDLNDAKAKEGWLTLHSSTKCKTFGLS